MTFARRTESESASGSSEPACPMTKNTSGAFALIPEAIASSGAAYETPEEKRTGSLTKSTLLTNASMYGQPRP
jgi:hypothetical protein